MNTNASFLGGVHQANFISLQINKVAAEAREKKDDDGGERDAMPAAAYAFAAVPSGTGRRYCSRKRRGLSMAVYSALTVTLCIQVHRRSSLMFHPFV
jgi:hypothetical protein